MIHQVQVQLRHYGAEKDPSFSPAKNAVEGVVGCGPANANKLTIPSFTILPRADRGSHADNRQMATGSNLGLVGFSVPKAFVRLSHSKPDSAWLLGEADGG